MSKAKRGVKPWTWKQISALRGDRLAKFLRDYGDRAKVAKVIANRVCNGSCLCWPSECDCCPMSTYYRPTEWSRAVGLHVNCPDNAIPIYRLMIEKLGRMPER